ncbi:hypothetical protein TcCL_Unassigned00175 [Trypanosoma cruzi]|nr:hypothetical protein TcCL_Unassigned00175 [Trypanosoma cruzi]
MVPSAKRNVPMTSIRSFLRSFPTGSFFLPYPRCFSCHRARRRNTHAQSKREREEERKKRIGNQKWEWGRQTGGAQLNEVSREHDAAGSAWGPRSHSCELGYYGPRFSAVWSAAPTPLWRRRSPSVTKSSPPATDWRVVGDTRIPCCTPRSLAPTHLPWRRCLTPL